MFEFGLKIKTAVLRVLILAGVGLGMAAGAEATPVTFGFEAVVTEIQGDLSDLDLSFPLAIGEVINGKYTFQTREEFLDVFFHHDRGMSGRVTLAIGGVEIQAATNLGLLNSGGVLDPPIPGLTSSIFLGYSSPTDVFPGWPGSIGGHPWDQRLSLVGTEGTIISPDDLFDSEKWNQLTLHRRLEIRLGFPNTVTVQAAVGNFTIIPEPTAASLMFVVFFFGISYYLFRRPRHVKSEMH